MSTLINPDVLDAAAIEMKAMWPDTNVKCGLVLGSGWGKAVENFQGLEIPYDRIPGLGHTGVEGHAGKMLYTEIGGMGVLIFQGRRHWYEGAGWTPVILPAYLLKVMGAESVLLTNASGGIREDLAPGSLVAISDHINQLGSNPLIGPHTPGLGTRFPDQTEIYKKTLREKLLSAGADSEGIYVATSGPTFETPAEIQQFKTIGADIVGMSTVPEAIVANALGLQVAGLSCVCNWAAGISEHPLTHDDVNATAHETLPRMKQVIELFLKDLSHDA